MLQDKAHLPALYKFSVSSGKLETPLAELSFSKEGGELFGAFWTRPILKWVQCKKEGRFSTGVLPVSGMATGV